MTQVPRLYTVHPLADQRWHRFLQSNASATVFHTPEWLEALRRTYGYAPIVFTTAEPSAEIADGVVFCRVDSWLTGKRLVSVPFADHCDPLFDNGYDIDTLFRTLEQEAQREMMNYFELRPLRYIQGVSAFGRSNRTYYLHRVDLTPDTAELLKRCHKDSVQRKIRRAQREGLVYASGRSERLLDSFYRLLVITRKRHGFPPQPKQWFRNLIECFGDAADIRVALLGIRPVASILTLRYKDTLVYKYGGSDPQFRPLGGTQLLFWKAIVEGKAEGARVFDLGRSDPEQNGLITFKDRWGSVRSTLTYSRFSRSGESNAGVRETAGGWKRRVQKRLVADLPEFILIAAGNLFYRHFG